MTFVEHVSHGHWREEPSIIPGADPSVVCSCGQRLYTGRVPADEFGRILFAEYLDEIQAAVLERMSGVKEVGG